MDNYTSPVGLDIDKLVAKIFSTECTNPQCGYVNSRDSNYCVKCGKLLPNHFQKVVINSFEYENLKKKANMSVWDKIKESFSK